MTDTTRASDTTPQIAVLKNIDEKLKKKILIGYGYEHINSTLYYKENKMRILTLWSYLPNGLVVVKPCPFHPLMSRLYCGRNNFLTY